MKGNSQKKYLNTKINTINKLIRNLLKWSSKTGSEDRGKR